jgi:anti-sigma factor RsiW
MRIMGALRHGTCLGARLRLDDLCDGALAARHDARLRRHVAGCRRCDAALAALEATVAVLGRLGLRPVPPVRSVRDRVAGRLATKAAADPGGIDR